MIKSVVLSAAVSAGASGTVASTKLPRPFSPIALVLVTDQHAVGSWWTVFFTKSDGTVTEPQPGDPPPILWQAQTTGTSPVAIPLDPTAVYELGLRLVVVFNNAATETANITVYLFYRER